jgi:hypothetical protein
MKYRVTGHVTISVRVEVEANSPAKACMIARGAPMQSLCSQCSHGEDGAWSTSGELDGNVVIRRNGVEEV